MQSSRKKSCIQCRQSKARCSLDNPQCSRCEKKKLRCKYEDARRRKEFPSPSSSAPYNSWVLATKSSCRSPEDDTAGHEKLSQVGDAASMNALAVISDTLNLPGYSNEAHREFDCHHVVAQRLDPSQSLWAITETPSQKDNRINNQDRDRDRDRNPEAVLGRRRGSGILNDVCWSESPFDIPMSVEDPFGFLALDRPSPVLGGRRVLPLSDQYMELRDSTDSIFTKWPNLRGIPKNIPNLLRRRPITTVSTLIAADYIWSTIVSYATPFCQDRRPPFIHSHASMEANVGHYVKASWLPEPLANCATIIPMFLGKTPTSTQFVLRTMFQETERLYSEFNNYDKPTLLYALQALTIYSILLGGDTNYYSSEINLILVVATEEIAKKVFDDEYFTTAAYPEQMPSWPDWIYSESRTRTIILLHIMAILLDISDTTKSSTCSIIDNIYLPCSKKLWEADTQSEWETQYKSYLSNCKSGHALKVGSLRMSRLLDVATIESGLMEDLRSWGQGSDSFGALLLIAVSHF